MADPKKKGKANKGKKASLYTINTAKAPTPQGALLETRDITGELEVLCLNGLPFHQKGNGPGHFSIYKLNGEWTPVVYGGGGASPLAKLFNALEGKPEISFDISELKVPTPTPLPKDGEWSLVHLGYWESTPDGKNKRLEQIFVQSFDSALNESEMNEWATESVSQ